MPYRRSPMPDTAASLLAAVLCLGGGATGAADLSLVGTWSRTIDEGDLVAGPGTGFRSPIESDPGQATLTIQNTGGASWRVKVRHTLTDLPTGVALAVRRSADGFGSGGIVGGENDLVISDTEQTLCEGTGDRTEIGLRYSLNGITIFQAPGRHGGTLVYQVE